MALQKHVTLAWVSLCVLVMLAGQVHAQPAAIELSGGGGAPGRTACLTVSLVAGAEPAFAVSVDLQFSGAPVSIAAELDCALVATGAGVTKACANRSDVVLRCGVYGETEPVVALPGGDLLRCCFTVSSTASPGMYPVADQCDAVDEFGNPLPVICGAGAITIELPTTAIPTATAPPPASTTPTNTHPVPTPTLAACIGDCSNSDGVTVDELLTMVNIALGNADVSTCRAGDANRDGSVTIDELLTAVNNALNGCGA